MFGLRGFRFMRLGKIINIKKIVRFTMCTQVYAVFGHVKAKVVRFMTRNSVIHDFLACSSGIFFLCDFSLHSTFRNVTPRIT